MKPAKNNLSSLSRDSTLVFLLRALYEVMTEYAVYIPDEGEPVVLSKGQLISLVERGCADTLIKSLPEIVARNIIKPTDPEEFDTPEDINALFIDVSGATTSSLERALNPDEPQFPEWWNAPVPFAMNARGMLRLNPMALKMFGNAPERLNAKQLPDREEFIVRVDGATQTRFITFKRLQPAIYSIEDCTEDLIEAQDITWWAAVGQAWVREIEAQGGKWQRLNTPPKNSKNYVQCDWQGESQGFLQVEAPSNSDIQNDTDYNEIENNFDYDNEIENKNANKELGKNFDTSNPKNDPDDVIGNIGPQAMALLAAGQTHYFEA